MPEMQFESGTLVSDRVLGLQVAEQTRLREQACICLTSLSVVVTFLSIFM